MPWTDWQFWMVTFIALWGSWTVVRTVIPQRRDDGSPACGGCASGSSACASPQTAAASQAGGSELVKLGVLLLIAAPLTVPAQAEEAAIPEQALRLHQKGFAELENEKPELAAAAYREVIKLASGDPLGYANLAIAELRQQNFDVALRVVDLGLGQFKDHPRLLAIKSDVLQWSGDLDGALELIAQAMDGAPTDLEVLYAAHTMATTVGGEAGEAVARRALERLAELRPENVVVLLQLGQQAIADGDRAAASSAFLRIGELLWQESALAGRALGMVTTALEGEDVGGARVPSMRLQNVLKVSAMYRESLRELKTGIQGIPLDRFQTQTPPESFGDPLEISFEAVRLDKTAVDGRTLAVADFDGDMKSDLATLRGESIELRFAASAYGEPTTLPAPGGLSFLLAADLDNDGPMDLLAFGSSKAAAWRGTGDGKFKTHDFGLASARAAAVIDFDIEGDLDLALVGANGAGLRRNALQGPLEDVGAKALPKLSLKNAEAIAVSDLDRDGDLDLAIGHGGGVAVLDNLRQGRFAALDGVSGGAVHDLIAVDLDGDAHPDLVAAGPSGVQIWRGPDFESASFDGLPSESVDALLAFDADNDGRLDLATAGSSITVHVQQLDGSFKAVVREATSAKALAVADVDEDGDLDLFAAGSSGLYRLQNQGGNQNGFLSIRLRGLDKGNSKNNLYGVGSLLEVRSGKAYQMREASGDFVHFGLGKQNPADVLRVVWTNGVPQNRLAIQGNQRLVEEQLLKGSCPFLYAWDGEKFAFVTDLLWGAPIGLPVAPGVWASSDPDELVRIDGLVARDGLYELRITEELWEAAFFDHVRLWVVDHPVDVETASNLRIVPGATPPPDAVLASRDLRSAAAAWDGRGRDVTEIVRERDEVYADGYEKSRYQGVAAEPWTFTFDLGEAPDAAVRLHLDGWIFPADASLNLAVAQRDDLAQVLPRLEVETAEGWQTLMPSMGFPPGKTKTMIIDLPPLPEGASKLRMVTNLWLHWDRIAWTTAPADDAVRIVERLLPQSAELRARGYSAVVREAPNAPHAFDYAKTSTQAPWIPFPGNYTRFGPVDELLAEVDDRSVILAPGDEMALVFDARDLPSTPAGFVRTLYLESHGWDKDADRNTGEGLQVEPLPFRAMSSYPYGDEEAFPSTPEHRRYVEEWLTRAIGTQRR